MVVSATRQQCGDVDDVAAAGDAGSGDSQQLLVDDPIR